MKSGGSNRNFNNQHTVVSYLYYSTSLFLFCMLSIFSLGASNPYDSSPTTTTTPTITPAPALPSRNQWVTRTQSAYQWGLFRWHNGNVACYLTLKTEERPTLEQVKAACGQSIHDAWRDPPAAKRNPRATCWAAVCTSLRMTGWT